MKYSSLVELYTKLEATSKRLEKTFIISEFLKTVPVTELDKIALLIQGRIFPAWDDRKIGVAARMVLKSISVASGIPVDKIETEWKKIGDLGKVTKKLIGKKKQATLSQIDLSVKKVFENLQKLPTLEGGGSVDKKVQLIAELLTSAKPDEAQYIIRSVLEDLRVGVADGTLRDAIVWAFFEKEINMQFDEKKKSLQPENREKYIEYTDAVQNAFNLTNDFSLVAQTAKEKGLVGLAKIKISIGTPLKVMLYPKSQGIEDAFSIVGKPAAIEYKLDGFRIQAHKNKGKITLFTRRLEEVTKQFPEVVKFVTENVKGDSFVLDSEAVAYDTKTGKYQAFQNISQRIKRKYDIDKMAEQFPVELNVFDVISYDGKNMMETPYKERRELIKKIIKEEPKKIVLAKQIVTESIEEAEKFYQESLDDGQEGVMFKNLEGIYKPGARVGYGVKVKPIMETLDLVIVGAEWGTGKRSGWMSSFIIACQDDDTGEILEIGRVGTGFKELEGTGATFNEITELLKPLIISEKGREVKINPKIVIEISYEEIQKSPTYSSGFALRFPRLVRLRTEEKKVDDINTVGEVEDLYYAQRGGR